MIFISLFQTMTIAFCVSCMRIGAAEIVEQNPELEDIMGQLQAPNDHGCDRYTQWINKLLKDMARISSQKYRRFYIACIKQLMVCLEGISWIETNRCVML